MRLDLRGAPLECQWRPAPAVARPSSLPPSVPPSSSPLIPLLPLPPSASRARGVMACAVDAGEAAKERIEGQADGEAEAKAAGIPF